MTPEAKKQLEGEADCHPFTNTYDAYMAGAQAAWDLAQKGSIVSADEVKKYRAVHPDAGFEDARRAIVRGKLDQPTVDDERDADAALEAEVYEKGGGFLSRPYSNYRFHAGFIAGRRGLREAVERAVKAERERCGRIANSYADMSGNSIYEEILHPSKEDT